MNTASQKKRAALQDREWEAKARLKHGEKYDYSRFVYVNRHTKGVIVCPTHGEFVQDMHSHLKGSKCALCSGKSPSTLEAFLLRCAATHGEAFDYSQTDYRGANTKVSVRCKRHDVVFEQAPHHHARGVIACPRCIEEKKRDNGEKKRKDWLSVAGSLGLDVISDSIATSESPVTINCKKHGAYTVSRMSDVVYNGVRCPRCANQRSSGEDEIVAFLTEFGVRTTRRDRSLIGPQEVDIVLPDFGVAIEFDGLYYHSTKFKLPSDHLRKSQRCSEQGVRLIHIFEDEWVYRQHAVKNMLRCLVGKGSRTFARKMKLCVGTAADVSDFLEKTHMQGCAASGTAYYLLDGDQIVSAMVFSKPVSERGAASGKELIRFASNGVCVGAASRLFAAFRKDFPNERVVSYSDNRLYLGSMYEKLGFALAGKTRPDYSYVIGQKRHHKSGFRKDRLKQKLGDSYDSALSEHLLCMRNGWYRIYDCGKTKWVVPATNLC